MNRIVHCLPCFPSPLPRRGITVTPGLRHRRGCPRYALFLANGFGRDPVLHRRKRSSVLVLDLGADRSTAKEIVEHGLRRKREPALERKRQSPQEPVPTSVTERETREVP